MWKAIVTGMFASVLTFVPNSGIAQHVLLENPDRGIHLYGELLEVSQTSYVIRTAIGEIMVPSDQVNCVGDTCPSEGSQGNSADFSVAGSDTVGSELMPLLIKGYGFSIGSSVTKSNVGDRLHMFHARAADGAGEDTFSTIVEDHGSSTGFKALLAGEAEIGMSSRPAKSSEVAAFREAGFGNITSYEQEHAIAADGLLLVVHPNNPVEGLTVEQVSGLLSGRIKNWSDVGGLDQPVTVYSRDNNSGSFSAIKKRFLEPMSYELASDAAIVPGNAEMASSVAIDSGGIGYTGIAFKGDTKPISLISSCGIATVPSAFSAKAGEYPLSRQLYLYTRNAELSEHAKGLLDFATSSASDEMIEKSGFIPFGVTEQSQEATLQTIRKAIDASNSRNEVALLRELFVDAYAWHRLSSTFRFRSGSAVLDNAARRDLGRLHDHILTLGPNTKIMLVGFTDSDGPLEANLRLSQDRAEMVRRELMRLFVEGEKPQVEIQVKGYGEVNPVACNDSAEGQGKNRRVEAWIQTL